MFLSHCCFLRRLQLSHDFLLRHHRCNCIRSCSKHQPTSILHSKHSILSNLIHIQCRKHRLLTRCHENLHHCHQVNKRTYLPRLGTLISISFAPLDLIRLELFIDLRWQILYHNGRFLSEVLLCGLIQVVLGITSPNPYTLTASKSCTMQIFISHSCIIALLCSL